MSNAIHDRRDYDPLDRITFDAIAYNAVGRASEIGSAAALSLTHSLGNSGWSVGIVQWDFGQPGRGEKVHELLAGYQSWASPDQRFTSQEAGSLTTRLQTKGQIGNALADAEQSRLNEYLRSTPGRAFVASLNQEQINRKWTNAEESLSEIEWLRDLRQTDPARATEIVAQTMKLYNQNEVRGGRLIRHLQNNEMTATQTQDWIGAEGIDGLNPIARSAIVSGRDNTLAGVRLMNELEHGEGRLSQAWRREVHDRNNPSLMENFNNNPDVQLLDAMMRNHIAGSAILAHVDNGAPVRHVVINGRNQDAEREMSRVELSSEGVLTVRSPGGDTFQMTREGWNRNGIPMQGRPPGRSTDEPDHTEGMRGMRPLTPDHEEHPDHATLKQIRAGVRLIDKTVGKDYDETSERLSRSMLAASKDNRERYPGRDHSLAANALSRVDHVVMGNDGRYAFVVEGDLHDPAHKRAVVDVVQAIQTPIEKSDTKLEAANQQIALERHLVHQQELQRQQTYDSTAATSPAMRI